MYHKTSISPLSSTQISKILNGHSVRVSHGDKHDVELSKEQFKKFAKAHKNGKAMTLTLDPFQIQSHQHLRGSGNLKRTARGSAKRLMISATDRAVRAIGGNITATAKDSGKDVIVASGDRAVRAINGSGFGGNITATAKDSGKAVITASGDRAVRAIEGSGVNRLNKANRWEQFANSTLRDGIDTAGKAARVYYDSTGPMAQMGFGLKKRKTHRRKRSVSDERKRGGALYPAGIP